MIEIPPILKIKNCANERSELPVEKHLEIEKEGAIILLVVEILSALAVEEAHILRAIIFSIFTNEELKKKKERNIIVVALSWMNGGKYKPHPKNSTLEPSALYRFIYHYQFFIS